MDPELSRRAQAGDRAALEALIAEVSPAVRRFTARMCRTPAEAEDAAQDALLAVAQHIDQYEGRAAFSTWVFTLARTACGRRRRGLKNLPAVADEPDARLADGPGPDAHLERAQLQLAIDRALAALHEEHREVVLLRDVEGLSAQEAAEVLGISVEALKSRLHRARAALRSALRPTVEEDASPSCPDIVAMMSQRIEGELDASTCSRLERHALACPRCRALCDGLKEALGACAALRAAK